MKRVLFTILMTISASAFADNVKYMTIDPIKSGNLELRDTWDQTKQFCYLDETKSKHCLDIVGMGEVKIRDHADWSQAADDQRFIDKLSPESRDAAQAYDRIFVRYLALDKAGNQFVVHVHFINKGSSERMSQTIFVTGDYQTGADGKKVEVRGMSFSSAMEYIGAAIHAAVQLKSNATSEQAINEQIVRDNQPLIAIGESVVNTFLGTSTASAPMVRP